MIHQEEKKKKEQTLEELWQQVAALPKCDSPEEHPNKAMEQSMSGSGVGCNWQRQNLSPWAGDGPQECSRTVGKHH